MKRGIQSENYNPANDLREVLVSNDLFTLHLLIKSGIDLNLGLDSDGNTILMQSILRNKVNIFNFLLSNGVNIHVTNNRGEPPIFIAYNLGRFEMVKALIRLFYPNRLFEDQTLLMMASKKNCMEIVNALIENKADINYTNSKNQTALHYACEQNNVEVVDKLIANYANPHIENDNGELPIDIAKKMNHIDIVTRLAQFPISPEVKTKNRRLRISKAYLSNLEVLSQAIILGLETYDLPLPQEIHPAFSNLVGYSGTHKSYWGTQSKPITLNHDKTYPVGYKIYLPSQVNIVRKIIVNVYGGFTRRDLADEIANRKEITLMLFSQKGWPVIELFLPDLLQDKEQYQMDKKLHTLIHDCIHRFYNVISKNPEIIHPKLEALGFVNADFYLFGQSFGGRTAIRHSQMFPNTFQGYISDAGWLSNAKEIPFYSGKGQAQHPNIIFPIHHVKKCTEKMLLLHNRDDNRVNVQSVLNFYKELQNVGKSHLANLCIFEKGSPAPKNKCYRKGHPLANDLNGYIEAIGKFLENRPSIQLELQAHSFEVENNLSNQFFRDINIQDRFIALATKQYLNNTQHRIEHESWNAIWEAHYNPIILALGEVKQFEIDLAYLKQHMKYLMCNKLLTDQVVKNAIKYHALAFRELYRELNQFEDLSIDEICENPEIIRLFKNNLIRLDQSIHIKRFLLESLFLSNPTLLPTMSQSHAWTEQIFKMIENQCRVSFENKMYDQKRLAKRAWLAVYQSVKQSCNLTVSNLRAMGQFEKLPLKKRI